MVEVPGVELVDPEHLVKLIRLDKNGRAAVGAYLQSQSDIPSHQRLVREARYGIDLKTFEPPAALWAVGGFLWVDVRGHDLFLKRNIEREKEDEDGAPFSVSCGLEMLRANSREEARKRQGGIDGIGARSCTSGIDRRSRTELHTRP